MKPLNVENKTRAMFWDCDECHLAMPVFFLTSESLIPSDVEDVVVDNWWCKEPVVPVQFKNRAKFLDLCLDS